jgi:hypothetical protein
MPRKCVISELLIDSAWEAGRYDEVIDAQPPALAVKTFETLRINRPPDRFTKTLRTLLSILSVSNLYTLLPQTETCGTEAQSSPWYAIAVMKMRQ